MATVAEGYTKAGIDAIVGRARTEVVEATTPFTVGRRFYSPVSYFWPDYYNEGQADKKSKWAETLRYATSTGYVVMNRNSGDWATADRDFQEQAQRALSAGVKRVLWYVKTQYGVASLPQNDPARQGVPNPDKYTHDQILQQLAYCKKHYGELFQGVFLDEMVNGWGAQAPRIAWYKTLVDKIRALYGPTFVIAGNPGANIGADLLKLDVDTFMVFENSAANFLNPPAGSPIETDAMKAEPSSRFWYVIHDVTEDNYSQVMSKVSQCNVMHLYVTDGKLVTGAGGQWNPDVNPYQNPPGEWMLPLTIAWTRHMLTTENKVTDLDGRVSKLEEQVDTGWQKAMRGQLTTGFEYRIVGRHIFLRKSGDVWKSLGKLPKGERRLMDLPKQYGVPERRAFVLPKSDGTSNGSVVEVWPNYTVTAHITEEANYVAPMLDTLLN